MTENNLDTGNEDKVESGTTEAVKPEKRKGFHPALVISTVAIVALVAWLCPMLLLNARINQNEERVQRVLSERSQLLALLVMPEDKREFMVAQLQTGIKFGGIKAKKDHLDKFVEDVSAISKEYDVSKKRPIGKNWLAVWLTPKFYGDTAVRTFCLYDNKVYAKDLGASNSAESMITPDTGWEEIKEEAN